MHDYRALGPEVDPIAGELAPVSVPGFSFLAAVGVSEAGQPGSFQVGSPAGPHEHAADPRPAHSGTVIAEYAS